jgi:hypothetical protein
MGQVFDFHPPGCDLVLPLALADQADHSGNNIFPGVALLARMTGLSERTVQRGLTALETNGWLQVVGFRNGGRSRATRWRINPAWIADPATFNFDLKIPRQNVTLFDSETVTPEATMGDTGGLKGDIAVSPAKTLDPNAPREQRAFGPPEFEITPQIREWARSMGIESYLEAHLDWFKDFASANGKRYRDWTAAFRNAVRSNWGNVRKGAAATLTEGNFKWWQSWSGIEAKARELSLQRNEGETPPAFKDRVLRAAGAGESTRSP